MDTAVKNLDDIQETDHNTPRPSRFGALVLASLGGACIVFASALLLRAPKAAEAPAADPLGELVAKAGGPDAKRGAGDLDVTFPRMLSDADDPTTALETIRKDKAPGLDLPPGHPTAPPPALDRLPVFPLPGESLPAQDILAARGNAASAPKDVLSTMAREASKEQGTEVEAGGAGGYQIQVSSFDKKIDGDAFAAVLRRRGHRAYVESADVKGKGVWHRVRIGPFKHKRSAEVYRQDFEAKERIVTFISSPPKTKVAIGRSAD